MPAPIAQARLFSDQWRPFTRKNTRFRAIPYNFQISALLWQFQRDLPTVSCKTPKNQKRNVTRLLLYWTLLDFSARLHFTLYSARLYSSLLCSTLLCSTLLYSGQSDSRLLCFRTSQLDLKTPWVMIMWGGVNVRWWWWWCCDVVVMLWSGEPYCTSCVTRSFSTKLPLVRCSMNNRNGINVD